LQRLEELDQRLQKAKSVSGITRLLLRLDPVRISGEIRACQYRTLELDSKLEELERFKNESQGVIKQIEDAQARLREALEAAGVNERSLSQEVQQLESFVGELRGQIQNLNERLSVLRREIVKRATVLATTLARAYTMEEVTSREYDVLVCDEASMAPIPTLFAAASLCKEQIVIGGDFRQLAPIATSDAPLVEQWLRRDVFNAAGFDKARPSDMSGPVVMLNEQYRMQPQISRVVSELAYEASLVDRVAPAGDWIRAEPCPDSSIAIYDTSSVNPWSNYTSSYSRFNIYSAVLSFRLAVKAATSFGPRKEAGDDQLEPMVAIITPYAAQARLLRKLITDANIQELVTADTVHRFQGLEKDVVIFDCVDGPGTGRVSRLLRDDLGSNAARLITVALSRARCKVAIVANCQYIEPRLGRTDLLAKALRLARIAAPPIAGETVVAGLFDEDVRRLESALQITLDEIRNDGSVQYFTEATFFDVLRSDFSKASKSVTIFSPFITVRRSGQFLSLIRSKVANGVRVKIFTRPPEQQSPSMADGAREAIESLKSAGADVELRMRAHEKLVFIDDAITYSGSLNVLSHRDTSEQMLRLPFRQTTQEIMRFMG
jgi:AAA domain/PLD-like domain